jgi:hypothetical protein
MDQSNLKKSGNEKYNRIKGRFGIGEQRLRKVQIEILYDKVKENGNV